MSTSSDDEPNLAQLFGRQSQHTADRSDDSALSDWIQSNTRANPCDTDVSSDHEDSDAVAAPSRAAVADRSGAAAAAADPEQRGSDQVAAAAVSAPGVKQPPGKEGSSAAAAAALPTVAAATDRSEVQVILPEKLIRNKVLIELEPAPHQATELSGDAGAVGRLVASAATAKDGQFKVDLKGVLYQATVIPLAGTALVLNIGTTDAKIESVMNDFVRLREESSYHDTGMSLEGSYAMAELMADDEDNYQVAGEEGKAGGDKPAAKKAAAAKRSSASTSKPAGSRSLKPAKAGAKKNRAKSKVAGKSASSKPTPKKTKAVPKSKITKSAPKPKLAKKKKQDSDDEDDWDDSDFTD